MHTALLVEHVRLIPVDMDFTVRHAVVVLVGRFFAIHLEHVVERCLALLDHGVFRIDRPDAVDVE